MASAYRLTVPRRILNALMRALLRLGVAPRDLYLLTTHGRRTGTPYSTPVTLVENVDGRWLVAPYGAVGWVQNVRAAGRVTLSRGRRTDELHVDEIGDQEAAPVLQAYLRKVRVVRPYFDVAPNSSLESFAAEASRHPVFRLRELEVAGAAPNLRTDDGTSNGT
jgi:deazaflavin-dependent oxidoreductase (nitroreductase family)